jgi:hypothetical protein
MKNEQLCRSIIVLKGNDLMVGDWWGGLFVQSFFVSQCLPSFFQLAIEQDTCYMKLFRGEGKKNFLYVSDEKGDRRSKSDFSAYGKETYFEISCPEPQ